MQTLPQQFKTGAGSTLQSATKAKENTGVPQYVPQTKKPSFAGGQDLRLQAAEALVFIREMEQDLSADELFYIEQVIDLLNRKVDEDHIDRKGVKEVLAWDF